MELFLNVSSLRKENTYWKENQQKQGHRKTRDKNLTEMSNVHT